MSALFPIKTLQFRNEGDLEERLSINAHNQSASGGGWVCFHKRGEGWVKLSKSGWTSMRVHRGGKGLTIRMCACFPLRYAWTATIRCYISQGKSKLHFIVQMSIDPIMTCPNEWWTCRVLVRHWELWNRKSTLWTDAKNLHWTQCCARLPVHSLANLPVFHLKGTCRYAPYFYVTFFKKNLNQLMIIMVISTIISVVGSCFLVHYSDMPRQVGFSFMHSSFWWSSSQPSSVWWEAAEWCIIQTGKDK